MHYSADNAKNATTRYALKCDTFSVQIAKTPIQIPIPQQSPELVDLGIFRPSLSISWIVDTLGQNTSNTTAAFYHMETVNIARRYWQAVDNYDGANAISTQTYYIPTKNALELAVYKWLSTEDRKIEIEIGDANYPLFQTAAEPNSNGSVTNSISSGGTPTGGGIYRVAIQQCRLQVDPATEDRWQFQMQFVCESREDVLFD